MAAHSIIPIAQKKLRKMQFKLFTDPHINNYNYSVISEAMPYMQRRNTLSINQQGLPPIGSMLQHVPYFSEKTKNIMLKSPPAKRNYASRLCLPELAQAKRNTRNKYATLFSTMDVKYIKLRRLNILLSGLIVGK